jgi:phosphoribosylanthranilate isomerase
VVKVKVCGIKSVEHAEAAVAAGADAIGIIFAESRRKVSAETAEGICKTIPDSIMKIGVFVDESKEEIERIAEETGLDYIQLHGNETPEFILSLKIPAYKALSITKENDLDGIEHFPGSFILVDSGHGAARGGNGTTFDWSYLERISLDKKVILAGGLNAENVKRAITKVNPYMVDVSSGVETNGVKDPEKIKDFILTVKNSSTKKEEGK